MSFTIKELLSLEVAPALGCTDPIALALGAAAAAGLLPDREIDSIEVSVDPNIYKNGLAVAIPGTGGLTGLETAAALGAFGGDPARDLEVLDGIDEEALKQARELVEAGKVNVDLMPDRRGIFVATSVRSGPHTAESVIEGRHDRITALRLNGEDQPENPLLSPGGGKPDKSRAAELETWIRSLSLEDLFAFIGQLDEDDLSFLKKGVETNLRLAEYGLAHGPGLSVGKTLERLVRQRLIKKDMILAARILTSAAADARMGGARLPAMSSGGSGNHGLTAVLPIWAVKDYAECDEKTVLQAIGLSHAVTAYVKAHTGRLSAVCGCSIAAGSGATAGITYLLGGDVGHVAGAIKNLAEDLAGVICDGAKAGCALKLATAAGTAVQAALFSLHGIQVRATDGIIGDTGEQTMRNIGELSSRGMVETDRAILRIMLEKRFPSQTP